MQIADSPLHAYNGMLTFHAAILKRMNQKGLRHIEKILTLRPDSLPMKTPATLALLNLLGVEGFLFA